MKSQSRCQSLKEMTREMKDREQKAGLLLPTLPPPLQAYKKGKMMDVSTSNTSAVDMEVRTALGSAGHDSLPQVDESDKAEEGECDKTIDLTSDLSTDPPGEEVRLLSLLCSSAPAQLI